MLQNVSYDVQEPATSNHNVAAGRLARIDDTPRPVSVFEDLNGHACSTGTWENTIAEHSERVYHSRFGVCEKIP